VTVVSILISYLMGSISIAYLLVKLLKGIDIRTVGSQNAGATNVQRIIGTGPAILVFILDILKGILAVLLGRAVGGEVFSLWCGVAVIIGHNWPIFFGFRGGKGTATSLGVIWMIMPNIALIITIIGIAAVAVTRYVSLGSIIVAPIFPLLAIAYRKSAYHVIFAVVLMFMTLYKHRSNIKRILDGSESKLGQKVKRVK
jgi:glycerol-3-phosphate acyltransferase PlsY